MRFTRHARNRMRWKGLLESEVEALVVPARQIAPGRSGNPRYAGEIGGRRCVVVVALDNPDVVITIFER